MGRRNEDPRKKRRRELIKELMKDSPVKDGNDVNALMREILSQVLEGSLEGELEEELGYAKYDHSQKETDNSRNGYSSKRVRSSYGDVEVDVPRDRDGEFEPQILKKHQRALTEDMEAKILSMYAKGMSTGDIEDHIQDLYGVQISDSTVSRITDKILPHIKEWQARPLESLYAVVFLDAIHFHVRSEGRIVKKAVYIALGVNMEGFKEVLGMWVGENESAKFWLSVMNDMRNRGLEDILIACVDGLSGFPAAIEAVYPKAELQRCIIHQIRSTTRFVSYKDIKELMADLKRVYGAVSEDAALYELDQFEEKWKSKYPQEVRTLIYTTNAIEGFNRQLRKVTKSKSVFPTDESLLKMLYLATVDITKKWTQSHRDWGRIHSQLEIYFSDRIQ